MPQEALDYVDYAFCSVVTFGLSFNWLVANQPALSVRDSNLQWRCEADALTTRPPQLVLGHHNSWVSHLFWEYKYSLCHGIPYPVALHSIISTERERSWNVRHHLDGWKLNMFSHDISAWLAAFTCPVKYYPFLQVTVKTTSPQSFQQDIWFKLQAFHIPWAESVQSGLLWRLSQFSDNNQMFGCQCCKLKSPLNIKLLFSRMHNKMMRELDLL